MRSIRSVTDRPPATSGPTRHDVAFESCGATLRGWLYPAVPGRDEDAGGGPAPGPGVVMAHGLSAVKEMFLDDYAAAFAAAGLTTLVYDHFGFGDSDGSPRQSPDASVQMQGYRDAVGRLAGSGLVDPARIGIWGSSFSGGQVVTLAAEDLPIACAVAQVPFLGGGGPDIPAGGLAAVAAALERGEPDATVPAVTATPDGEGVMFADGAYRFFTRVAAARAPSWRNELHVGGLVGTASFEPLRSLPRARVPLLLIVAPDDALTPPGPALGIAAAASDVEVLEIPGGHFDAYEAGFGTTGTAAIDWFRSRL